MTTRRDFILQTCSFCAAAAGLAFVASQLEGCKTTEGLKVSVTKSQIIIPKKAFEDQKNYLVKNILLEFDVLVLKNDDGTYSAIQMMCTHRRYPLRLTPKNLVCDNHGSEFDFNGDVT